VSAPFFLTPMLEITSQMLRTLGTPTANDSFDPRRSGFTLELRAICAQSGGEAYVAVALAIATRRGSSEPQDRKAGPALPPGGPR